MFRPRPHGRHEIALGDVCVNRAQVFICISLCVCTHTRHVISSCSEHPGALQEEM